MVHYVILPPCSLYMSQMSMDLSFIYISWKGLPSLLK